MYNHSDESVQYMKNDSTPHHTSQEKMKFCLRAGTLSRSSYEYLIRFLSGHSSAHPFSQEQSKRKSLLISKNIIISYFSSHLALHWIWLWAIMTDPAKHLNHNISLQSGKVQVRTDQEETLLHWCQNSLHCWLCPAHLLRTGYALLWNHILALLRFIFIFLEKEAFSSLNKCNMSRAATE